MRFNSNFSLGELKNKRVSRHKFEEELIGSNLHREEDERHEGKKGLSGECVGGGGPYPVAALEQFASGIEKET